MIILGIDPGTTAIGFALLECGRPPRLIESGLLAITSRETTERLGELHRALSAIITRARPDVMAVEKLFFAKNAKTAMDVAQARGAILLTAALHGITVVEYAPREIKKALTGDGGADKEQVKKMVILTMPEAAGLTASDDVFDAIASAVACCFQEKLHLRG